MPEDGADGAAFSENIRANALMQQAEAFFAQGKLEDALKNYQTASGTRSRALPCRAFLRRCVHAKGRFRASRNLVSESDCD